MGGGGWGGEGGGGAKGFLKTSSGRIDVGVCYTRGATSRRWCGWWERRGRWGGGVNCSRGMDGSRKIRGDIKCVEVSITLADFDVRWGV